MTDDPLATPPAATPAALPAEIADLLKRNGDALVPAVVQDATSGEVLMMAWMDDSALAATLRTRRGTYFSRSRNQQWVKGETSGNTQHVREVRLDCDGDTILLRVDQSGPACHTGLRSCFDTRTLLADDAPSADSPTAAAGTEAAQ